MSFNADSSPSGQESVDQATAFVRDNADAFVLDALSAEESRRFRDYLAERPEAYGFVSEASLTAEALAFSMPLIEAPDLAVKLQLFDRIAAEPATSAESGKVNKSNEIVAALSGSATRAPVWNESGIPTHQRNWMQYVGAAMVAPLTIALVVVSMWAYNMNDELDTMRDDAAATNDAAGNDSTSIEMLTMESSDTSSTARGSIGAMPDQTSAVLLAWDLDPKEEHEVWCEESDGKKWMVSALEVSEEGDAMQTIKFPGPIDGYKRIFVAGSQDTDPDAPELILTIPEKSREDESDLVTSSPTP